MAADRVWDKPLDIAIRVYRDGRWASHYISELRYLTDEEIQGLAWRDKLVPLLQADAGWHYVGNGWMQEKEHGE